MGDGDGDGQGEGGQGSAGGDGGGSGGDGGKGGEGGGDNTHFSQRLGGEVSGHPGLQKFADETALATSYIELEKSFSAQGIRVPNDDAPQDQIDAYYEHIGVPKTAGEYDVASGLEIPEGLPWDGEAQNAMVAKMHELKLTPGQVAGVLGFEIERQHGIQTSTIERMQNTKKESAGVLKQEWGSAYDAKVRLANLTMQEIFGDTMEDFALLELKDGTMIGQSPAFVRAMARAGEDYSEHDIHGMGSRKRMTLTKDEAKAELTKLENDETFQKQLGDKGHPGHDAAVQRRMDLYAMGGGEQA